MLLFKSTVLVSMFIFSLSVGIAQQPSTRRENDLSENQNLTEAENEDSDLDAEKTIPLKDNVEKDSNSKPIIKADLRNDADIEESSDLMILANRNLDAYLFISTLEGGFYAVNKHTGDIRWILRGAPVLRAPLNLPGSGKFLPDPRDGTLYMYQNHVEGLRKLPFTIPELVAASPSRSSDGIIYTGSKKDTWFAVDPFTGLKQQVMTTDNVEDICPSPSEKAVLIGRTEYTISMYDTKLKEKRWNVTFMDYSTHSQVGVSDMNYFASCSEGILVTLQPQTADVVWIRNFHSPVVAMYSIESDALVKLPFTTVAPETLRHLTSGVAQKMREDILSQGKSSTSFFPTLYIGEYKYSMYALPSIVDESVTSGSRSQRLLIEGPTDPAQKKTGKRRRPGTSSATRLIFGFHKPPKDILSRVPADRLLENHSNEEDHRKPRSVPKISPLAKDVLSPNIVDAEERAVKPSHLDASQPTVIQIDLKVLIGFIVTILGFILFIVFFAHRQIQEVSQRSNISETAQQSNHSIQTSVSLQGPYEDLLFGKGFMRIGKIVFDTKTILGHGCEGTIVYRGKFDGRDVAVKRLLPECYSFADREVELLRESDLHPNVIRYFCMEQDHQFRYIALELCLTTLHDFIENNRTDIDIQPVDILKQALSGLGHLHRLDIVHRDCKPQNVLITFPDGLGRVRALISDFGLCKKLGGRKSMSRRSGVAGTEGWMAPEQLNLEERTSTFMDIFSAGCVVYYVLSKGSHPFGDKIHRQSNILRGDYDLACLDVEKEAAAFDLVSRMIQYDPRRRPTAEAVLRHPFFWTSEQCLAFYSDVSDRIEKEPQDCKVVHILELKSESVVRQDWRAHISVELQNDLRRFRSYRGTSVRDLLRALRNKKHHFRECSEDVQRALGFTPNEFYEYFSKRFPLLLMHTYNSLKSCHLENTFKRYYDIRKSFPSCEHCEENMCYTHAQFGFDSSNCCSRPREPVMNGSPKLDRRTDENEPVNLRAEALLGNTKPPVSIFDDSPKKARNPRYRNHRRRNTGQTTAAIEA